MSVAVAATGIVAAIAITVVTNQITTQEVIDGANHPSIVLQMRTLRCFGVETGRKGIASYSSDSVEWVIVLADITEAVAAVIPVILTTHSSRIILTDLADC